MEDFNLILKEERELSGLSQAEAARLLLVPYRTWQDWERATYTPAEYVQKAILYSLNAAREDMMAAELYARIASGLLSPDAVIDIERDGYDRIIDWRDPANKITISYQMEEDGEIENLDALRFDKNNQMKACDALQELYLRAPYLSDEDLKALYPDD